MKVIVRENYEEMSRETANLICDYVNKKPNTLLSFPSGSTPLGTLRYLVDYAKEGRVNFTNCKFVGLDEWIGMTEKDKGSCKYFLYKEFFRPLNIDNSQICFFNACTDNLEAECKRVDNFIFRNGKIGLILVGLGMNGHIGLNEPGVSFDLYSHTVKLDKLTKEVAQKYFDKPTKLEGGITLGLKHIIDAEMPVMIVNGNHKAEILKRVIDSEVTNKLPATVLKLHNNSYLIADKEAAHLLE